MHPILHVLHWNRSRNCVVQQETAKKREDEGDSGRKVMTLCSADAESLWLGVLLKRNYSLSRSIESRMSITKKEPRCVEDCRVAPITFILLSRDLYSMHEASYGALADAQGIWKRPTTRRQAIREVHVASRNHSQNNSAYESTRRSPLLVYPQPDGCSHSIVSKRGS